MKKIIALVAALFLSTPDIAFAQSGGAIGGGGAAATPPSSPSGRLTLVTNTPVLTSDQTAKSQVFYDCFRGNTVPYYTGSADASDTIASCEVSLTMATSSTGVTNASGVFDVWWVHSGANRICVATNGSGGGWASDTAGSNTARGMGYSQIHNTRGYWTNVNAIASCYNGATNYGSVSADQATYLGTLYTTGAGQTGMSFSPAAATGGTNNILGLYNAYNRVNVFAISRDSTVSWTYASATFTSLNASASNRISFVDGLQQSTIDAANLEAIQSSTAAGETMLGVTFDGTGAPANGIVGSTSTVVTAGMSRNWSQPLLGFHFAQAVQSQLASGVGTYYGLVNGFQQQQLSVSIAM